MPTPNFNMEDPAEQEKIRRGPHEYIPTAGKHGAYVSKPYQRQEYPKMMGTLPQPKLRDFQRSAAGVLLPPDVANANFQAAMADWDAYMTRSIVKNAAEEKQWLRENGTPKPAKETVTA